MCEKSLDRHPETRAPKSGAERVWSVGYSARLAPLIVGLLVLSLATNVFPVFNMVAILGLFPLRLFWSKTATPDRHLGPRTAVHFLIAADAFWILSYMLTTAPLSNMLSFGFLRFEGALLVGYLPLLLFGDVGLSPGFVRRLLWAYLAIQAGVAVLGIVILVPLVLGRGGLPAASVLDQMLAAQPNLGMPLMFLGLYRTHMTTGIQYAMAALIALCFMLHTKERRLVSLAGIVFIALLAGLILSGARTAYVAFVAVLLFQFAWKKRYFRPLVRIAALTLVPAILFLFSQRVIFGRAASIVHFEGDTNVARRFNLYHKAVEDFLRSPIIGIGFGRYDNSGVTFWGIRHVFFLATTGEVTNSQDFQAHDQVHDSYLQFLAEGGIVGLFLMLGVWVATYRWAGRLRRKFQEGTTAAALCEVVQASVLVTFFSSLTGTTMMTATTPLFVFTMVGLLRNVAIWECRSGVPSPARAVVDVRFPHQRTLSGTLQTSNGNL